MFLKKVRKPLIFYFSFSFHCSFLFLYLLFLFPFLILSIFLLLFLIFYSFLYPSVFSYSLFYFFISCLLLFFFCLCLVFLFQLFWLLLVCFSHGFQFCFLFCAVRICTPVCTTWSGLSLTVSKLEAWANPQLWQQQPRTNYTTGGLTQPTQRTLLEHPVQEIKETSPLSNKGHHYKKPDHWDWESQQFYLIHRSKHRESSGETKK